MGFFSDLWSSIKNTASNVYNKVKDVATGVWNKVSPFVRMIPIVGNKIAGGVEAVAGAVDKGATGIAKTVTGDIGGGIADLRGAYNAGKEGINQLTNLKKGGMVMPLKYGGMAMNPYRVPQKHHNMFQK
jgi:phage-related protein